MREHYFLADLIYLGIKYKGGIVVKQDSEILLSTTPSLDGYEITEYIDVISSETVYKLSLSKAFASAFNNVIDSWKIFSSNELSGTTKLIHEAKEYVKG